MLMRGFSSWHRSCSSALVPVVTILAFVSGAWVGCFSVESVRCVGEGEAEDWYCPSDMQCHDTRRCVYPGDVEACEDLYEGASCTSPSVAEGVCEDGVCIVPGARGRVQRRLPLQ